MNKNKFFFDVENISVGQSAGSRWVEDSYVVGDSHTLSRGFMGLSVPTVKAKIVLVLALAGLLILLGKSFYLQTMRGGYYFSLAESNRVRTKYIKTSRGVIFDRQGEILVQNVYGFSLLLTPADLPAEDAERQKVIDAVAAILNIDAAAIKAKIEDIGRYYFQSVVILTGIEYERAMALKVASAELPGVNLEIDSWRKYFFGPELSHLLGYVGKINAEEYGRLSADYLLSDNIGKVGLEKRYESCLKGEHGRKRVEVDVFGQEKKIISYTPFVPGCDLTLTVDLNLQKKISAVLKQKLGDKKAASVIVSDPHSGEILAMVDYPSYDNNLFSVGISIEDFRSLVEDARSPLFSRSVAGEYPSGSIIKPLIALAALKEKIVIPQTTFHSTGGLWVGQTWFFPDWKEGGHGLTNVYKAIAESVNTYFYYIGGGYGDFRGLGIDLIDKYLTLFGFGRESGIDLPGEKSGLIPTPAWKKSVKNEAWYIGDTYHLAIGQGDFLVTPLQINNYVAAIASGGRFYQPRVVKEIAYYDGRQEIFSPQEIKTGLTIADEIAVVRQGMRQAVLSGSAAVLRDLPVKVAAKTGTAQWNSQKNNHAWLIAFAPFEQPSFAITVLVEEGGEGSVIAAAIAKEVMSYWFDEKS